MPRVISMSVWCLLVFAGVVFLTFFGADRGTKSSTVAKRFLPKNTLLLEDDIEPPIIQKQNSEQSATMSVALAGNLSIRELTEIADKQVKKVLERSTGVGEVQIVGGLERAVNIWVEADRLAAYRLPKGSDAEKAHRNAAIQLSLQAATETPLACAQACAEVVALSRRAGEHGYSGVISDAGVGVLAANTALRSAALNVYINAVV